MKKRTDEERWLRAAHIVMVIFCILVIVPFLLLIIASFTDNKWAASNGFSFLPEKWSLEAYSYIAHQWATIGRGYLMTILVTIIGTVLSILFTSMYAYGLSDEKLPGSKILSFLTVFTMLFSGGIVASYYCWINLFHVRDTIWALIFPGLLMNGFNIILV